MVKYSFDMGTTKVRFLHGPLTGDEQAGDCTSFTRRLSWVRFPGRPLMTDRDFCYWLHGYFELAEMARKTDANGFCPAITITPEQLHCIRNHLRSVFENVIEGEVPPLQKYERDTASVAHVIPRRC